MDKTSTFKEYAQLETTSEVLTEITVLYAGHITILDHGEFISGNTLYWLGQTAKSITRMVILLIHDQMWCAIHVYFGKE